MAAAGLRLARSLKTRPSSLQVSVLNGHFPARTDLMAALDDRTPGYRQNPTEEQRFHGVIICIAASAPQPHPLGPSMVVQPWPAAHTAAMPRAAQATCRTTT